MRHRCLEILEILAQVADCVPVRTEESPRFAPPLQETSDLVAMACTCKLFYEPAMNTLWEELRGLDALKGIAAQLHSTAPFRRIHLYANLARVKQLSIVDSPQGELRQILRSIPPNNSVLLPSLNCLNIFELNAKDAESIRSLLGPKLKFVWVGASAHGVAKFLPYLPEASPELETLSAASWPQAAHGIIADLPYLRQFNIFCWTNIPTLTQLHLSASSVQTMQLSCIRSLTWQPTATGFSSLTTLHINDIIDYQTITSFLHALPPSVLECLSLGYYDRLDPDVPATNEAMDAISRFHNLLDLSIDGWKGSAAANYNIDPLLLLRKLKVVWIRLAGMERQIVDGSVEKLCAAWPDLCNFGFEQDPLSAMVPAGLTLESLGLFAEHCPGLERLALAELDATAKPGAPKPSQVSEAAITLDLSNSLISEASWPWVAKYISAVYPNAKLRVDDEYDNEKISAEMKALWKNVEAVLPVLSSVRTEGCRHAPRMSDKL